jgi:hypothetical protein
VSGGGKLPAKAPLKVSENSSTYMGARTSILLKLSPISDGQCSVEALVLALFEG